MTIPMGWKMHEWTYRLDAKAIREAPPGAQVETGWGQIMNIALDIEKFYTTQDKTEAKRIIDAYGIEYVYVGDLERQTYTGLQEAKFSELGEIVFESGNSRLFKLN